ncbi:hypothetical protein BGW42_004946 [Actinomortierella wolfii]|nr:hypothetical protein BGW42_004946 [Actinomortierella wolfii]
MGRKNKAILGRLSAGLDNTIIAPVMQMQTENPNITAYEIVAKLKDMPRFQRQKRDLIEKSVERVLATIKSHQEAGQAAMDDGNEVDDGEDLAITTGRDGSPIVMMEVKDTNQMNKNITGLWNRNIQSNNTSVVNSASSSPVPSEPGTPVIPQEPTFRGLAPTLTPNSIANTPPAPSGSTQPPDIDPLATDATPTTLAHAAVDMANAHAPAKSKKRAKTNTGSDQTGGSKRYKSSTGTGESGNRSDDHPPPSIRLEDLGGVDHCIEKVKEYIMTPLAHPEVYQHMGVKPPRGILLHGPPGTGKTMMANAIAGSLGVPFITISAPSVVSGMSGESEKKIREVFEEAKELAPCLLFIDEVDAITPKRETAQREMERRIVAQLLTCMDDLSWENTNGKPVMIIGATNRPDSLDPALRRAGRFDVEINVGVPDQDAREQILRVMSSKLRLAGDFDFKELAKLTPGYVGADLNALTAAAGVVALKRIFQEIGNSDKIKESEVVENVADELEMMEMDQKPTPEASDAVALDSPANLPATSTVTTDAAKNPPQEQRACRPRHEAVHSITAFLQSHPQPLTPKQLEPLFITNADFMVALTMVQPSAKREGFATVPDVTWDDIGALSYVREELQMAVVEPIKYPHLFRSVGIQSPAGVLLWGPPGCGKTILAKAVANESRTNFISVKGPELLNKYVGESERGIRQVFARARASAPCVIFFDELDALCSRRDDNQSDSSARVVNTLLTELDGMENRSAVYVIAATNRPDMIDPAMLRPGRLDKLLYVELPTAPERLDILKTLTKKTPLGDDVSLERIAFDSRTNRFSGADLASLVREAAVSALRSTLRQRNAMGKEGELLTEREFAEEQARERAKLYGSSTLTSTSSSAATPAPPDFKPLIQVMWKDFETAFSKVSPSVSPQDKEKYDRLRVKLGCATAESLKELEEKKKKKTQQHKHQYSQVALETVSESSLGHQADSEMTPASEDANDDSEDNQTTLSKAKKKT